MLGDDVAEQLLQDKEVMWNGPPAYPYDLEGGELSAGRWVLADAVGCAGEQTGAFVAVGQSLRAGFYQTSVGTSEAGVPEPSSSLRAGFYNTTESKTPSSNADYKFLLAIGEQGVAVLLHLLSHDGSLISGTAFQDILRSLKANEELALRLSDAGLIDISCGVVQLTTRGREFAKLLDELTSD